MSGNDDKGAEPLGKQLASAIELGKRAEVSMGCAIELPVCKICGKTHTEL